MRRALTTLLAGLVLSTSVIASTAPAAARHYGDRGMFSEQYRNRDHYEGDYRHGDRRGDRAYYRGRDRGFDNGAAAVFGLAAGAIVGSAIANSDQGGYVGDVYVDDGHVNRCLARYRTYDPQSDTYIANNRGERRQCRL